LEWPTFSLSSLPSSYIQPCEIEDVLSQHADVAMVAVPDDKWGEAVTAVVVARGYDLVCLLPKREKFPVF
jgi:acyl-CoA synthetase (AMP-forming)/AMP-acid ligase II